MPHLGETPARLDFIEREVTDHGEELRRLGERVSAVEASHAVLSGQMQSVEANLSGEIQGFRDEWREQRRFWRSLAEKSLTEVCAIGRLAADKLLPWPLVVVVVVGMVLGAGIGTFGGTLAGQSFHVGQANDANAADVSGAGMEPQGRRGSTPR